ncbi:MAG: ribonucleotide-diphosphate reductase subunit beta [Methanobrevibacter sp.]|jgi:U3 small nucleolar ribonucleoprotein protein IMP4|nr:ribonucleotide-diphosphate reductase subunit beta [Methanobrevibacter sp.]
MLISTSRKPSQKTRAFCKNLSHALGYEYLNRGKMSMRDLQLKSKGLNYNSICLVYEMKGNPSKISFFSNEGEELLVILGSINTTNERLHIKTDEIAIKCDFPELEALADILNIKIGENPKENYIFIEKIDDDYEYEGNEEYNKKIAKIHFFNKFGEDTGLKIAIRKVINS